MAEVKEAEGNTVLNSKNLDNFKLSQILFNNAAKRTIGLLGVFQETSETDQAIIIVEKVEFAVEIFTSEDEENLITKHITLDLVQLNDIYSNYLGETDTKFSKLKISMIYPATEKHISKYVHQSHFVIEESPEMYKTITLPFIEKEQFSMDWVYNILEHKDEVDKIIFEDPDPKTGFILLPDYKWNGQIESMYLLSIIIDRSIRSIRDLNASHLPLLENIKAKSTKAIKEKYGVDPSQVRAYFHYHPSFYHLHVHFNFIMYDAPGIYCDKAHLLNTVIDNIKLVSDYYQKATLTFVVGEKRNLYQAFKDAEKQKQ